MSLQIIETPKASAKVRAAQELPATEYGTWLRVKFVLALAFLAGLALSPKLWLSERWFPLIPVVRGLPPLPAPFDRVVYGLLLVSLAAIAVRPRPRRWIGLFVGLMAVLAVSDQMRWQPWAYQYLWMLGAVALYAGKRTPAPDGQRAAEGSIHLALNAVRLIVVCTYFWSGMQKVNADFVTNVFPYLIKPFAAYLPAAVTPVLGAFGYAVPAIESLIGIGLLFPRSRKLAAVSAIAMHAFILLSIGPLGHNHNSVVWPWNLAMISFVLILFCFGPAAKFVTAHEILWPVAPARAAWYPKLALLMLGLVPTLSLINLWDAYMSFALYSGYTNEARVSMVNAFADRLPKPVLYHVFLSKKPGITQMYLQEWSFDELNVPINPEPRIYKGIGRYLCSFEKKPGEVKFYLGAWHNLLTKSFREYDCPGLASE